MWQVIQCPATTEFKRVAKEQETHGNLYIVWERYGRTPCWICQSVPVLIQFMNQRFRDAEKHLRVSPLYRILRGESTKQTHKNHEIVMLERDEMEALNRIIRRFPACNVVTKDPEKWALQTMADLLQMEEVEDSSLRKWMRIIRTGNINLWKIFRGWADLRISV